MKFIDFLKSRESDLITAVSEKDWLENKVYFVDEIISMIDEWEKTKEENKSTFVVQQIKNRNVNGIYSTEDKAESAIKLYCEESLKSCIHSYREKFSIKEIKVDDEIKSILL